MTQGARPDAASSVAFVTGAGRGIGRAVALAFAQRGFDVALVARTQSQLEGVANEVRAVGRRAAVIPCDVSSPRAVDAACAVTLRDLGTPRAVVCGAGIVHRTPVQETSDDAWRATLGTNLDGAFYVSRAFLPSMLAAKRGRIVTISSISATLGTARQAAYCASKWGLTGFTKALAAELHGTGLQALSVLPGAVDTDMLKGGSFPAEMGPDDVAKLVVFAALDAPDAMNGSAVEMFGP